MAMTGRDLVETARKAVPKMSNAQLQEHLTSGAPIVILDVREKEEWMRGIFPGDLAPARSARRAGGAGGT